MPKNVTLPDGTLVRGVPDELTVEEVIEILAQRDAEEAGRQADVEAQEAGEPSPIVVRGEETVPLRAGEETPTPTEAPEGVVEDERRNLIEVLGDSASFLGSEAKRILRGGLVAPIANTIISATTLGKSDEDKAKLTAMVGAVASVTLGAGEEDVFRIDERGRLESDRPESFAGKVAPYIIPASGAYKVASAVVQGGLRLTGRAATIASLGIAGSAVDQLVTDPFQDNLFNIIEDLTGTEGQSVILDFLAVDEDDEEAERRVKMFFQDATFSAALGGSIAGLKAIGMFGGELGAKFLRQGHLSDEESGKMVLSLLRRIKRRPSVTSRPTQPLDVAEGVDSSAGMIQVEKQAQNGPGIINALSHGLEKVRRQALTSRGYLTENGFRMFNQSQSSQRAMLKRAERLSDRLVRSMRANLRSDMTSDEMAEQTAKALQGDKEMFRGLPKDVRESVKQSRDLIDALSKEVAESPMITQDFREQILDNVGDYLRTSYKAFQNANYKPDATDFVEAQQVVAEKILRSKAKGPGFDLVTTYDDAMVKAKGELDTLLGKTNFGDFLTHLGSSNRIHNSIFRRKKSLDPTIKKLLGEITDPADNVLLTIDKLSDFVYKSRYFESIEALGRDKYLFSSPQGIFTTPVTGTNSMLDFAAKRKGVPQQRGFYTTPEMAKALAGAESKFVPNGSIFRWFASAKGASQAAKTVYSHPTHMKNFLGGMMFRMAGGNLPFSENSSRALRTVMNDIKGGGDTAFDDFYEEMLGRGIINTNTKVNEFRELINAGASDPKGWADFMAAQADKIKLGGAVRAATRKPGQVYMGTDDFFKINSYLDEFDSYKLAFPKANDEQIKRHVAEITKNIIPNYDLVPKAIKQLRNLPFGNFAGFSSEMMRTSLNIAKLGFMETTSGNPVLVEKGLRRIVGLSSAIGGIEMAAESTQKMAGYETQRERDAFIKLSERPWSPNPTAFAQITEDGKMYSLDMASINPYNFIGKPLMNVYKEIADGTMQEDAFDNILLNAAESWTSAFFQPFLSESIITKPIANSVAAVLNEGKGLRGETIYEPGMDLSTVGFNIGSMFWEAVEPGTVTALRRLDEAAKLKPQIPAGAPRDLELEKRANTTGMRWNEIKPLESVQFAARDFSFGRNAVLEMRATYQDTPQDILDRFKAVSRQNYLLQKELYEIVEATETLGTPGTQILQQMQKERLTMTERQSIFAGNYIPPVDAVETISQSLDKVFGKSRPDRSDYTMSWGELQSEMARLNMQMRGISLRSFSEDLEENEGKLEGINLLREGK